MDSRQPDEDLKQEKLPGPFRKRPFQLSFNFLFIIIMLALLVFRLVSGMNPAPQELSYSEFKNDLMGGQIASVLVSTTNISGKLRDGTAFTTVRVEDPELTQTLEAQKVEIRGQVDSNGGVIGFLLTWIFPVVLMVGLWYLLMGRNKGGAGSMGNIFSFGKSKARVIQGEQTRR